MNENVDILPRSVSDALMQCRDLREYMEGFSLKSEPLNDDVRERMQTLAGWLSPETMAQNLASALQGVWSSMSSGQGEVADHADTVLVLSEWAASIADVAAAVEELNECLSHDERVRANVNQPGGNAT